MLIGAAINGRAKQELTCITKESRYCIRLQVVFGFRFPLKMNSTCIWISEIKSAFLREWSMDATQFVAHLLQRVFQYSHTTLRFFQTNNELREICK